MDIRKTTINNIRVLSAEMIDKANSGHPGLPLGCAGIGYELYAEILKHNPANPDFIDRDRFILSSGHGSALIYSLLHIFGYGLKMEDIENFRQLGSAATGHPEHGLVKGVEATTGPLGQGISNAVGMAIAESMLAAQFNKPDIKLIDHYTYALCGDGCMMEGIESESASLAGTLKLGKLIVIYDSNGITIEGATDVAFTEDVAARHIAQGWQVLKVASGEDIDALKAAVLEAKAETNKPSLIIVKTRIGEGSSKAGSASTHGSPLGAECIAEMKKSMGWEYPPFSVATEVKAHIKELSKTFAGYESAWNKLAEKYAAKYPEDWQIFKDRMDGVGPDLTQIESIWTDEKEEDATRNTGGRALCRIAEYVPGIVGGTADLVPSTKAYIKNGGDYGPENRAGRNVHFGIREHAMGGICNGIALHGGFIAFSSTFHVFSDYMRNPIRMAALMQLPVFYVFTHDSIGVGEDGPTHQPIEQTASLRLIPGLDVYRPADYSETASAYVSAVTSGRPTVMVLSRQNLPALHSGTKGLKGAYVVAGEGKPDVVLLATGSEVSLALKAKDLLAGDGINARVVSMPCVEAFERQSIDYQNEILPVGIKRIVIEAGATAPWYKYAGSDGAVIGIDSFGASGKANKLFEYFGFTPERVAEITKEKLGK